MGKVHTKNKRRKRKCTKKNKRTRKKRGKGSNRCQIFRQQQRDGVGDEDERVFDQIEADDYCYVIEGHPNEHGIAEVNYCNKEGECEQKDGGRDLHPVDIPPLLERQEAIDPDEFIIVGGKKRIKRKRRRKSTKKKRRRRRRCTKKKRKKR
jgi:hypothetical protein